MSGATGCPEGRQVVSEFMNQHIFVYTAIIAGQRNDGLPTPLSVWPTQLPVQESFLLPPAETGHRYPKVIGKQGQPRNWNSSIGRLVDDDGLSTTCVALAFL